MIQPHAGPARSVRHIAVAMLLAAACAAGLAAQAGTAAATQPGAGHRATPRDEWQRPADIFAALEATEGSRIADVGAGEGWLTTRLSKRVGATGRVFAVDISETALRSLQRTVEEQGLRNVELVLGEEDDPRLPYASLDGIVVLNAYHEMVQRVAMLSAFKRSLRPGGLLVIVDNVPADSTAPRQRQTASHQLWLAHAEDDLIASGFEIVRKDPSFVAQPTPGMAHRQWLLVARRVGSK
jgi:predicted methyltransferase